MTEKLKKASRLISAVQIHSIRLVDDVGKSTIRSAGDIEAPKINVESSAKVPDLSKDGIFYVLASFDLQVLADESKTPAATLKATFELKYSLPKEMVEVTSEELTAFAEVNAIFNAWPYWREFIQSTFVRMNLPPVLLPVFRLSGYVDRGEQKKGK